MQMVKVSVFNVRGTMTLLNKDQPLPKCIAVNFTDRTAAIPIKQRGFLIGKHLVIAGSDSNWQVFFVASGKPIIESKFVTYRDAALFSDFIENVFDEFLPILETYPDADLFGLCKWSVPDGIRIFQALQQARKQIVDADKLNKLANEAKVSEWLREY